MSGDLVLVTGGSGFVGGHCIVQLVQAGYRVRTTVRSLRRESEVRAMLAAGGCDAGERLSFVAADLAADAGWAEAVAGCRYVLHVASPFPPQQPKDEQELIVPAREGTLRVLRAARDAGAARVVVTSSVVAIAYGHPSQNAPFDETSWTNLAGAGVTAYAKSKTLAERAAWEFIAREGGGLELSVVNPAGIFGPVLSKDYAASILLVEKFLNGSIPACPRFAYSAVDVRDVADLHLRAMTDPAAEGERFMAVAGGPVSVLGTALLLKKRLGAAARKVPTRELPDWLIRMLALVSSDMKMIVPELGKRREMSNEKARRVLGWMPRSLEESLMATAESLIRLGVVK